MSLPLDVPSVWGIIAGQVELAEGDVPQGPVNVNVTSCLTHMNSGVNLKPGCQVVRTVLSFGRLQTQRRGPRWTRLGGDRPVGLGQGRPHRVFKPTRRGKLLQRRVFPFENGTRRARFVTPFLSPKQAAYATRVATRRLPRSAAEAIGAKFRRPKRARHGGLRVIWLFRKMAYYARALSLKPSRDAIPTRRDWRGFARVVPESEVRSCVSRGTRLNVSVVSLRNFHSRTQS